VTVPGGAEQPAIPSPVADTSQVHDREIGEFFATHREAVRSYLISSYGCSGSTADDVLQDSILAVREYWERVRTLEKPAAYLYKVAGRRLQRQQGERAQHEPGGDCRELLLATPDPGDGYRAVEERMTAMALLRDLPLRQRQVLWLRRAAGFTAAQTAEILSIRPGTVKSSLHDAETRLQELLRKSSDTWEANIR
jgi:RNA polymerase sigma-70 factor, ECF subfamily